MIIFNLTKYLRDYFQLMGTILSRIQEIATKEAITIGALERKIGASKGVLSRAISNGTDIQSKWLQVLVDNYPQYSATWILTGRGSMLHEDACTTESPSKSSGMEDKLLNIIQAQAEEIGQLRERINQLERVKTASTAHTEHTANVG